MIRDTDDMREVIRSVIETMGPTFEFPAGGAIGIPTPQERQLIGVLRRYVYEDRDLVNAFSHESVDYSIAYDVAVIGVRLAILALREKDNKLFSCAVIPMLVGSRLIDWRDALRVLAIAEFCANTLGYGLRNRLQVGVRLVGSEQLGEIVDGYWSRSEDMRQLEAVGLRAFEGPDGLTVGNR